MQRLIESIRPGGRYPLGHYFSKRTNLGLGLLLVLPLTLAAGLMFLSITLSAIGGLLERSPWTVLTVGGLATLLVSATLLYWLRDSEPG